MAGNNRCVKMIVSGGECSDGNVFRGFGDLARLVTWAVDNEIDFFQLREKKLSARSLFDLTRWIVDLAAGRLRIIVNGRFDIALAAGAAGVHLPADSLPVAVVRSSSPVGFAIGVSTHSIPEIRSAAEAGADYALFGPIFATPDKGLPVGTEELKRAVENSGGMPVVAVGGIDGKKIDEVLKAGAAGFAAIRYFQELAGVKV
ncbi:MAG: thiamine phosphate synthase [Blastocatellia bacterium]